MTGCVIYKQNSRVASDIVLKYDRNGSFNRLHFNIDTTVLQTATNEYQVSK